MKNTGKQFISYFLVLSMLLCNVPIIPAAASSADYGDPFAAMYDSEAIVREKMILEEDRIDMEIEMEYEAETAVWEDNAIPAISSFGHVNRSDDHNGAIRY